MPILHLKSNNIFLLYYMASFLLSQKNLWDRDNFFLSLSLSPSLSLICAVRYYPNETEHCELFL